ncbi:GNAT family N-acetyltransferase [Arthrobacter sp. H41]|uniref:GNAT family N-acetyltransferase n=1 Tax=Arthrobacter sp. H41 TaxID=1312978 RepID=UPI004038260D
MSSVFVEPAHRGRGFARAVVSAGLSWLDGQGAEVVDLQRHTRCRRTLPVPELH